MEWLQQLVNGISIGSIYALIALGYTMVYGIIKLINFAHGDVFMIGAFVGFYGLTHWHIGFIPSLLAAMVICSILGVVIERLAYKRLRNATRIAALITAIGMSLLIEYTTISSAAHSRKLTLIMQSFQKHLLFLVHKLAQNQSLY